MQNRNTSPKIQHLEKNEIFVFGSNLSGHHDGGAAYYACRDFGAIYGQGVGLQGQSYAIPTMQGGVETIKPYVDEFTKFAQTHTELNFLVTRVGCGIAGFTDKEIAPLFAKCVDLENVALPKEWWEILKKDKDSTDLPPVGSCTDTVFKYNKKGELECYDKKTGKYLGKMATMGDYCTGDNEKRN